MHRHQDSLTAPMRTDWPGRDRPAAWRVSNPCDRAKPPHLGKEPPGPKRGGWRWLVVVLFIGPPFTLAGDAIWRMHTGQGQDHALMVSLEAVLGDFPKDSPKPAATVGAGSNSASGVAATPRRSVIPSSARAQTATADSHVPVAYLASGDTENVRLEAPPLMEASWAMPADRGFFPSPGYGDAQSVEIAAKDWRQASIDPRRASIQADSAEAPGRAADEGGAESATKESDAAGGSGGTTDPIELGSATSDGKQLNTGSAVVAAETLSSQHDVRRSRIASFIEPGQEGEAEIVLELQMSQAVRQSVAVLYATEDGTAKAGEDYEARSGALIFEPGQTLTTLRIPILDDDRAEDDESFELFLTVDPGVADLDSQRIVATIRDNERSVVILRPR